MFITCEEWNTLQLSTFWGVAFLCIKMLVIYKNITKQKNLFSNGGYFSLFSCTWTLKKKKISARDTKLQTQKRRLKNFTLSKATVVKLD